MFPQNHLDFDGSLRKRMWKHVVMHSAFDWKAPGGKSICSEWQRVLRRGGLRVLVVNTSSTRMRSSDRHSILLREDESEFFAETCCFCILES